MGDDALGHQRDAQVDGWIEAASLELTPADRAEIGAVIEYSGAGAGLSRPA
jgi:hypothetical protein